MVNLYYTEQGRGFPVILLHGYPLAHTIWKEQQAALSDQYRIITPDLRGHGRSPVMDGTYEMESMASDVVNLMDQLKLPQAIVMGHSMGGYVTLALARYTPSRLKAIGLIGSQMGADTEEARQGRYKMVEKVSKEGSIAVAEAMIPKLFAPVLNEDEDLVEPVRNLILATKTQGIIGTLRGMAVRPDSTELLASLELPVLLVAGDQDQIIPLAKAEAMLQQTQHGTLATIEHAGHMMMMEQPRATTMAMRSFLEEVIPVE